MPWIPEGGKEDICKLCHFEVMCMCVCTVLMKYSESLEEHLILLVLLYVFFLFGSGIFRVYILFDFLFWFKWFRFTSCSTSSWFPFDCGAAIECYFTSVYLKDNGGIESSSLVIYTYDDVTYAWAMSIIIRQGYCVLSSHMCRDDKKKRNKIK